MNIRWCGVALKIPCPNCGPRPFSEFSFGGEERPPPHGAPRSATGPRSDDDEFARVYLRDNAAGPQRERWFHAFGCRRWVSLTRDTVTNHVDALD